MVEILEPVIEPPKPGLLPGLWRIRQSINQPPDWIGTRGGGGGGFRVFTGGIREKTMRDTSALAERRDLKERERAEWKK